MPYSGYVQLSLDGSYAGQSVVNLLYYGNDAGETIGSIDGFFLSAFGAEWAEAYAAEWASRMVEGYSLDSLSIRAVNAQGVVISDVTQVITVGEDGAAGAGTDGAFVTTIISFSTERVESEGTRALKRSYLAVGPVASGYVDNDGALSLAGVSNYAALLPVVTGPVSVGFIECNPVRIGRTVAPETPAVGLVLGAALRPYVSTRKSRKRRPSGV
jgi:hypothetical protein